eukprot:Ihof_evm18s77 gene=Ihof_evmTU18s77
MSAVRFSAPKSRCSFVRSHVNNPKSNLDKLVREHHFNCAVDIFLPGCSTVPDTLSLPRGEYWSGDIPVSGLTGNDFVNDFVKKGQLYALSYNTPIDRGNAIAVATGHLVMAVTKDTYEELGLDGKKNPFEKDTRYDITVDMTTNNFKAGRPLFDRVQWCLTDRLSLTFPFLMQWLPESEPTETKKLTNQFPGLQSHIIKTTATEINDLPLPDINTNEVMELDEVSEAFYEWLGIISCGADWTPCEADGFTSTYCCDLPTSSPTPVSVRSTSKGFIVGPQVLNLLHSVRDWILSQPTGVPYVVLSVWGFDDTPISWGLESHGYFMGGE